MVSTLAGGRAPLPFRVVFACGMGEGRFPSPDAEDPLDLRWARRREGDVTARDRDRYAFLELLLGTRDRLLPLLRVARSADGRRARAVVGRAGAAAHARRRLRARRRRARRGATRCAAGTRRTSRSCSAAGAGALGTDGARRGARRGADAGAAAEPRAPRAAPRAARRARARRGGRAGVGRPGGSTCAWRACPPAPPPGDGEGRRADVRHREVPRAAAPGLGAVPPGPRRAGGRGRDGARERAVRDRRARGDAAAARGAARRGRRAARRWSRPTTPPCTGASCAGAGRRGCSRAASAATTCARCTRGSRRSRRTACRSTRIEVVPLRARRRARARRRGARAAGRSTSTWWTPPGSSRVHPRGGDGAHAAARGRRDGVGHAVEARQRGDRRVGDGGAEDRACSAPSWTTRCSRRRALGADRPHASLVVVVDPTDRPVVERHVLAPLTQDEAAAGCATWSASCSARRTRTSCPARRSSCTPPGPPEAPLVPVIEAGPRPAPRRRRPARAALGVRPGARGRRTTPCPTRARRARWSRARFGSSCARPRRRARERAPRRPAVGAAARAAGPARRDRGVGRARARRSRSSTSSSSWCSRRRAASTASSS